MTIYIIEKKRHPSMLVYGPTNYLNMWQLMVCLGSPFKVGTDKRGCFGYKLRW